MPIWVPAFGSFGDIAALGKLVVNISQKLPYLFVDGSPEAFVELVAELEELSKLIEKVREIIDGQKTTSQPVLTSEHIGYLEEDIERCKESVKEIENRLDELSKKFGTPFGALSLRGKVCLGLYRFGWQVIGEDKVKEWADEIQYHHRVLDGIVELVNESVQASRRVAMRKRKEIEDELAPYRGKQVTLETPKGKKVEIDWSLFGTADKRREFLTLLYRRSPKYTRKVRRNEYKFIAPDNSTPNLDEDKDEITVEVGSHVKLVWLPRRAPQLYHWTTQYSNPPEVQLPGRPGTPEPSDSELPSDDEDEPQNQSGLVIPARSLGLTGPFPTASISSIPSPAASSQVVPRHPSVQFSVASPSLGGPQPIMALPSVPNVAPSHARARSSNELEIGIEMKPLNRSTHINSIPIAA